MLKDRVFYDESGGGVTFSGGEPLLQYEFLTEALTACRKADLRTAVETTGFASWEKLQCPDPPDGPFSVRCEVDGCGTAPAVHRCARMPASWRICGMLAATGARVTVRVPLVPGVNDDEENIRAIARFVADLGTVPSIHLLPFHAGASGKYHALGMEYAMEGMRSPAQERMYSHLHH